VVEPVLGLAACGVHAPVPLLVVRAEPGPGDLADGAERDLDPLPSGEIPGGIARPAILEGDDRGQVAGALPGALHRVVASLTRGARDRLVAELTAPLSDVVPSELGAEARRVVVDVV